MQFGAMNATELLCKARNLPQKPSLDGYREAILVMREKGYTWREIAAFLSENGITTDHTKILRLVTKPIKTSMIIAASIPIAKNYETALLTLEASKKITPKQLRMLKEHANSHDRTITFLELAKSKDVDFKGGDSGAKLEYGKLGRKIGELAEFAFNEVDFKNKKQFRVDAIGRGFNSGGSFHLVMHHELAKAIDKLGWAKEQS